MTKAVVGITGATGFIGSALADYLSKLGYTVVSLVRDVERAKTSLIREYDLSEEIPEGLFAEINILIDCAFVDLSNDVNAENINYEAKKRLVKASADQGVEKIIFFSSVSAKAESASAYGRSKNRIHSLLDVNRDVILKCSLVIGNSGLFHKLMKHALKYRLVPVFDGGHQILQVIAIDDVTRIVGEFISHNVSGVFTLANTEQQTYKSVFREIAHVFGVKVFFLPVTSTLIKSIVRCSKILGLRSPISEENINGLNDLEVFEPSPNIHAHVTLKEKLTQMRNDVR